VSPGRVVVHSTGVSVAGEEKGASCCGTGATVSIHDAGELHASAPQRNQQGVFSAFWNGVEVVLGCVVKKFQVQSKVRVTCALSLMPAAFSCRLDCPHPPSP
jgi:hypothetical protein